MEEKLAFDIYWVRVRELLLDQPVGTSAEFTDYAIAFWNGSQIVGLLLRDDGSGQLDEEYDLDFAWDNWHPDLLTWLEAPRFAQRPELLDWIRKEIV